MIITSNSPSAGYVAWQDIVITHKNISYTITNGNSDKKYLWWDFSAAPTTLQESNTMPTMTDNDAIIIYNDSGTYHLMIDTDIHGGFLIDGTVTAAKLEETYVETTGNETIGGIKTFTDKPILPSDNPATDFQASHKKYVDDNVGAVNPHKDTHDPEDGSDALDAAAPANIDGVQASGEGSSHSLARADHAHRIQHGIANNALVTIDHDVPVATDYAKFTANGLEGREKSEVLSDLNVANGADVTGSNAPQAHKTSHESGGGDAIKLDDLATPDDNTDLDASITKHGLLSKLPNDDEQLLFGDGTWGKSSSGKNLILNAAFLDSDGDDLPDFWDLYASPTLTIATDTLFVARGGNQVTITATGAAEGLDNMGGVNNWLKVLPSTKYTFSIDYKCTAGDTLWLRCTSYNGAIEGTAHFAVSLTETSATRYVVTFTTDADADNLRVSMRAYNNGDIVIISHLKLEQGAIATPYNDKKQDSEIDIINYYNAAARAYPASDQDDIADATWVQVVLGTEDFDTGADFATNQFTVPVTGFYEIEGCVMFENTDAVADKQYGGAIYVDPLGAGSDAVIAYDWRYPALAGKFITCRPTIMKKLNKTDEVNLWAFADTGGATQDIESGSANTYLSIRLVKLDV